MGTLVSWGLRAVLAAILVLVLVEPALAAAAGDGQPAAGFEDLGAVSSLEYWHLLAAALPVVIGQLAVACGWTGAAQKARLSIAVYLAYAVIGEALKGSFDTLTWGSPQLVLASLIKAAGISYVAYKLLRNMAPKLVGGDPGPGG